MLFIFKCHECKIDFEKLIELSKLLLFSIKVVHIREERAISELLQLAAKKSGCAGNKWKERATVAFPPVSFRGEKSFFDLEPIQQELTTVLQTLEFPKKWDS